MIEENNRIMEQRNESLKESSEQTRKRLIDLLEEKTKLERELNDVSMTLSDTNRQLGILHRQHLNTKAELSTAQEEVERLSKELDAARLAKNTAENAAKHFSNSLEQGLFIIIYIYK
jgi:chromosome segregation ATPase